MASLLVMPRPHDYGTVLDHCTELLGSVMVDTHVRLSCVLLRSVYRFFNLLVLLLTQG